jgi:hypothetical protein
MSQLIGKLAHRRVLASLLKTPTRSNYYFVLPEVPQDTAETNALMRNENLPALNELDIKKVQNGFQKLSINFDNDLNTLLDQISNGKFEI